MHILFPIVQYGNTFSFKLCSLVVNGVRSTHEGTLSGEYVRKTVFRVKVGVCLCNIHAEDRFFFCEGRQYAVYWSLWTD
jgi:hypothetical protein